MDVISILIYAQALLWSNDRVPAILPLFAGTLAVLNLGIIQLMGRQR